MWACHSVVSRRLSCGGTTDLTTAPPWLQSSIDPAEDVDLTGLVESTVDSDEDEEDLMGTTDSNPR